MINVSDKGASGCHGDRERDCNTRVVDASNPMIPRPRSMNRERLPAFYSSSSGVEVSAGGYGKIPRSLYTVSSLERARM